MQQLMKFIHFNRTGAGVRFHVAPTIAGAVIDANLRKVGDALHHRLPFERGPAESGINHHCGHTLPLAVEMHAMPIDVDEAPRRPAQRVRSRDTRA